MPSKSKNTSKATKSSKKSVVKQESAPAPAPAPAVENTVEAPSALQLVNDRFAEVLSQLDVQRKSLSETIKQVREMQKQVARDVKALEKRANKRKPRKQGEYKPSGFAKETLISDELAKFLGKPQGTLMARTEVTKEINTYIKKHKLQDPTHGKNINPDKRLKNLLRIDNNVDLTYFNIQRYMKHLFPKPAVSEVAETA